VDAPDPSHSRWSLLPVLHYPVSGSPRQVSLIFRSAGGLAVGRAFAPRAMCVGGIVSSG